VDLKGWTFSLDPRQEWRQMFTDAWRMERDYFYDRAMNGVDWPAMRKKYFPLVDRVADREELSDIFSQMISELSALHMFVRGGDVRQGTDHVLPASLGAELEPAQGGWRVTWIYQGDPEAPESLSPLARPGVDVKEGDLIEAINGTPLSGVANPALLLRNQAGRQVLLQVRHGSTSREVVVVPITPFQAASMRYGQWEFTRRK
jgi:tricorn protease